MSWSICYNLINPTGQRGDDMSEKFLLLPKERQQSIINAAFEEFGKFSYKHTIMDTIARNCGISKGLLFYYFKNKKALYEYLVDYSINLIETQIAQEDVLDDRDLFSIFENTMGMKVEIMKENPYLFAFMMRSYDEEFEDVLSIKKRYDEKTGKLFAQILSTIDYSRFKDSVDPALVLNLIGWSSEGFMRPYWGVKDIDLECIKNEYSKVLTMLKENFYKEEYI